MEYLDVYINFKILPVAPELLELKQMLKSK